MLDDFKFQTEFSLEQCRKKYPELAHLSDEELLEVRDTLYELAQLAVESWKKKNGFHENPTGFLTNNLNQPE